MIYKVRNWEKFQHYSKRNPPWIRLYFDTLSSEDWVSLSDAGRVLAVSCMLIASRNDGRVSADPKYIKRVAYLNSEPDFEELVRLRFLIAEHENEDASKAEEHASMGESDASMPESDASYSVMSSDLSSVMTSGDESVREGEVEAAELANEFWSRIPGMSRPTLTELREHFKAKLHWLRANGRDETERIKQHIMDPKRDRAKVNTINKMFLFWGDCGIEEKTNVRTSNTAPGGGRKEGLEAPSL